MSRFNCKFIIYSNKSINVIFINKKKILNIKNQKKNTKYKK